MAKLKLFQRKKTKEDAHVEDNTTRQEIRDSEEKKIEPAIKEETKEAPIKEYNKTLYPKGFAQQHNTIPSPQRRQLLRRTTWQNAETIEQNIDSMRLKQSESTSSHTQIGIDTEKKVDFILLKKKK